MGSFLDTPARETSARSRTRRNSTPATFITPTALSLARAREGTEATGAADVSDDVREEVQAAMDRMVEFVSQHAAVEHSGGREGQESLESFQVWHHHHPPHHPHRHGAVHLLSVAS